MSNRRKQMPQSDYTPNDLADSLLSRILACVDQKNSSNDVTKGAIVTRVNEDGTVNVRLPADDSGQEFTRISNQSVYELNEGDSVELYLKGGRYSNCWVIAKHGMGGKRVALESQKGNTVVVSGGGGTGTIPESLLSHLSDYNNPHKVTKEQLGLSKVVTSINGESGDVNIPTIINDAKLTIQQNGTEVGNFTANSAIDKTVNIVIPTKLSELEDDSSFATKDELPTKTSQLSNDSGYLTSADIPNIPVTSVNGKTGAVVLEAADVSARPSTWTPNKSDVGLSNVDDVKQYSVDNPPPYPVTSVNGKSGKVSLEADDVGAVSKTGDTMTGTLKVGSAELQTNGYVTGTWLRTTANTALSSTPQKVAVIKDGWIYSRTLDETKTDIGLGNVDNVKQYSASNPPPYPVTSVNGKAGAVELTATDVGALPNTTTIPTKTSQLSNDSGYITSEEAPVQSVNGKIGAVELVASDVGAISTNNISQTLGNSSTKIPSEKAVVDAMSAAGYGDMLKAKYANNSTDDTVDKAFSDANGNNIADTYVSKDGGILSNINANTLTSTGTYVIGKGCTNFPSGSEDSVVQVVGAGGKAYQTTVIYSTNTFAHRAFNGADWTPWRDANGAIVSASQPEHQNVGSLWFKEI